MKPMIIAIDGPAGAGKGTLARHLAGLYTLAYLDTGLLYRAVALKMLERGLDLSSEESAAIIGKTLDPKDLKKGALRDESVGNAASQISAFPRVRAALLNYQREFPYKTHIGKQGAVLDGRDIGLVVLPEAICKIYVTASPEVRAKRRLKELHQKGINSIYEAVLEDIKTRDTRDETRDVSPLRPAEDAFILDTSELGIDDVVEKACVFVDSKYPNAQKKNRLSSG